MPELKKLAGKLNKVIEEEGVLAIPRRAKGYLERRKNRERWKKELLDSYSDVLFISGCNEQLPHPHRYRVLHQMEQLMAQGMTAETVYYTDINRDMVRCYSVFIIFRCPLTPELEVFVREAHRLHKKVFYDVDDLVIDTCYTDQIAFLSGMSPEEREAYDANVRNMGAMLSLCDGAITTTAALARELANYVPKVFINRNCASEEMTALSEAALKNRMEAEQSRNSHVVMGYFSGSATHLDDMRLILPALKKILRAHPEVILRITGILSVPEELQEFSGQIETEGFVDYHMLPERIRSVDINLAPITDTIFNAAKSENKWVEAALVKVPTIASNLGAFAEMIRPGIDGILTENTEEAWTEAMENLICSGKERGRISQAAYERCRKTCITVYNSRPLADFLEKERGLQAMFVLPAISISGGIRVALIHARMLYEEGVSVSLLTLEGKERWMDLEGIGQIPVLPAKVDKIRGKLDLCVATMWNTCAFVKEGRRIGRRLYLVQGYEMDLYEPASPYRLQASATYKSDPVLEHLTVSRWCQNWMLDSYGTTSRYIPNGINLTAFRPVRRDFSGKIRILVEGDSSVAHKNVDESFRIIEKLPKEKYEIWYMSYAGEPKDWYRVDRFLHKVPYEKIGRVYEQCHILLKTSLLESFSYPPLEMMATGGCVVVLANDGNREYIKNRENCMVYEKSGDLETAVNLIRELVADENLRETLRQGALKQAGERDWNKIRELVLRTYLG